MKRFLALFLVLLMIPVAGLALEPSDVTELIHADRLTEEPVTLRVMARINSAVETWKENTVMLEYENKTGVHIDWIEVNDAEFNQQVQLTLASGDTPDIILGQVGSALLQTYGAAGVIMPLNDLIENYTVNAKRQLAEAVGIKDAVTAPDGNIYSLWQSVENTNESIYNKQFLFLPWFNQYSEATGAGMPETLDEYRAMLEYFRDNDMNGNGDATDEIPMLGNMQAAHEGGSLSGFIISAFQLWNCNAHYHLTDDGEVVYEANTDAYRDALRYMNKLYEDGIYPEEDFILNLNDYRAIVNATTPEDIIVGLAAAPFYMRCITHSIYNRAYLDFEALPPLKNYYDPNVREIYKWFESLTVPQAVICGSCEHPEIAIQWLDYWLGDEGSMLTTMYGIKDRDYVWTDEFPSMAGNKPSLLITSTLENSGNKDVPAHTAVPNYISKALFESSAADMNSAGRSYHDWRADMAYEPYGVLGNVPRVVWCADEDILLEYQELSVAFGDYVRASMASFVLGKTDIDDDAAWQAYLDELEAMGLERYLEIIPQYLGKK